MKIAIIGSPGAGKSTLARELGDVLKIEVIHLDRHFWQPKWKEKPKEIRRQIMQKFVEKDQWIIEGTYLDTSDIRLKVADTIIFLDTSGLLCLWRVINRYFKYRRRQRPDLPEGCRDKLRLHYMIKILGFPLVKRKRLYTRLCKFESDRTAFYAFRTKSDVDHFLKKVRQGQTRKEHMQGSTPILDSERRQMQEEYLLENMYALNAIGVGVI